MGNRAPASATCELTRTLRPSSLKAPGPQPCGLPQPDDNSVDVSIWVTSATQQLPLKSEEPLIASDLVRRPGGPCESRSRHLGIKSPLLYPMS